MTATSLHRVHYTVLVAHARYRSDYNGLHTQPACTVTFATCDVLLSYRLQSMPTPMRTRYHTAMCHHDGLPHCQWNAPWHPPPAPSGGPSRIDLRPPGGHSRRLPSPVGARRSFWVLPADPAAADSEADSPAVGWSAVVAAVQAARCMPYMCSELAATAACHIVHSRQHTVSNRSSSKHVHCRAAPNTPGVTPPTICVPTTLPG